MKKSLVVTLALVFVLGIAGTALAANPFTDVPANHWAYASVSKLAQAGVIEGYGDGRFIGNNNMTRFEMAQIVARAMAKMDSVDASQRAQIEKLAAEFADELDSLGVRVAKLEKNADNVKITGEVRFSWYSFDKHNEASAGNTNVRTRITLAGQVNDRWQYGAMIQNEQNLQTNAREDGTIFRRAWVQGSLGVVNVTVGRFAAKQLYGITFDEEVDGATLGYKQGNLKFDVYAWRPVFNNTGLRDLGATTVAGNNQVYGASIGYDNKKLDAGLAYYRTDASLGNETSNIFEVAAGYKFNQDWKVWAEYLRGSKDINNGGKSGWVAGVNWGEVKRNKPGTIAARFAYYDVPAAAVINTTPELDFGTTGNRQGGSFDGYKGWQLGASWIMARNIDLSVDYFDFKGQNSGNGDNSLLWTYVRFYF